MISAMYLVAVIEARTNELMNYPKGTRYKQKYSTEGFEDHLQIEFEFDMVYFRWQVIFIVACHVYIIRIINAIRRNVAKQRIKIKIVAYATILCYSITLESR